MDADEYQRQALRTVNDSMNRRNELTNYALGITGEAGEVADLVKKHVYHGHPLSENKLRLELGDVLWYVATMADSLGCTLSHIMELNVDKLRTRFPDGFSAEASMNRKV